MLMTDEMTCAKYRYRGLLYKTILWAQLNVVKTEFNYCNKKTLVSMISHVGYTLNKYHNNNSISLYK